MSKWIKVIKIIISPLNCYVLFYLVRSDVNEYGLLLLPHYLKTKCF